MRFSTRLIPILFLASGIASAADMPHRAGKRPDRAGHRRRERETRPGPESISVRGELRIFGRCLRGHVRKHVGLRRHERR